MGVMDVTDWVDGWMDENGCIHRDNRVVVCLILLLFRESWFDLSLRTTCCSPGCDCSLHSCTMCGIFYIFHFDTGDDKGAHPGTSNRDRHTRSRGQGFAVRATRRRWSLHRGEHGGGETIVYQALPNPSLSFPLFLVRLFSFCTFFPIFFVHFVVDNHHFKTVKLARSPLSPTACHNNFLQ